MSIKYSVIWKERINGKTHRKFKSFDEFNDYFRFKSDKIVNEKICETRITEIQKYD